MMSEDTFEEDVNDLLLQYFGTEDDEGYRVCKSCLALPINKRPNSAGKVVCDIDFLLVFVTSLAISFLF